MFVDSLRQLVGGGEFFIDKLNINRAHSIGCEAAPKALHTNSWELAGRRGYRENSLCMQLYAQAVSSTA